MFCFIVGGNVFYRYGVKYVLSFLNLKIDFIVSEFENNFWRGNCREQYNFTKSLEIFP